MGVFVNSIFENDCLFGLCKCALSVQHSVCLITAENEKTTKMMISCSNTFVF